MVYALVIGGWFLFDASILLSVTQDHELAHRLHSLEHLVFLALTTLALYYLLRREQQRIDKEANARENAFADLQTIFEHLPLMIDFYDPSRNFRMVNQEWSRALGWTAEQLQGRDMLAEFYSGLEDLDDVRAYIAKADRDWRHLRMRSRSGAVLDTAWTNVRLPDGAHIGIGQDLTSLKYWREALEESRRHIQLLINEFPITLFAVNKEGVFVLSEGSGLSAFGLNPGEAVGRSMYDVCANTPVRSNFLSAPCRAKPPTARSRRTGTSLDPSTSRCSMSSARWSARTEWCSTSPAASTPKTNSGA